MGWLIGIGDRWRVLLPALGLAGALLAAGAGAAPAPRLTADPASALAGATIRVDGRGFPKQAAVALRWDGATAGMPAAETDRSGAFSVRVTVPAGAAVGAHTLAATAGGATATTAVQVLAPAAPSPSPTPTPSPTRTPTATATATATATRVPATTTPATTPTSTATVAPGEVRVEAGNPALYTDVDGRTWAADQHFEGGSALDRGAIAIAGTRDPRLYQTERWGLAAYRVPLANGAYTVRLHFAETYSGVTAPGQRVFGVAVEGTSLGDIDVVAQAGGTHRALVKSATVNVADGRLDVAFTPRVQSPLLNAIEVVPASPTDTLTTPATPTVAPSPSPTPMPSPTSSPLAPIASIQAAVDAAAAGSTVRVPAGTYRETVTIRKPLVLDGSAGAVIDGELKRAYWVLVQADDVTVRGFAMKNAATPNQDGGIQVRDRSRVVIENNVLTDTKGGAPVSVSRGTDTIIRHNELARGGQEGIHATGVTRLSVLHNRIHSNNQAGVYAAWEAGGVKATVLRDGLFEGNEVYANDGPGLWCDIDCQRVTYRNNRLHHNVNAGIFWEVSDGALIEGNAAWENGYGHPYWGWGAGILVSSGRNAVIRHNTVAWNADGITVLSQDRTDWPAFRPVYGNHVHDNVIATRGAEPMGLAWLQDWAGVLFDAASNNRGAANTYWRDVAEPTLSRFEWAGSRDTLAKFNATPGEEGGRYLTAAEKDALLQAAGIPTAPEPR